MKKIERLKLGQLNKDSMGAGQQSQLWGGGFCYWSQENYEANGETKCSCVCWGSDYYSPDGFEYETSILLNVDNANEVFCVLIQGK